MNNNNNSNTQPFISVFMAIRNEINSIEECITAFLNQTYPKNSYEIVIADKSEDGTRQYLDKISEQFPETIKVFDNQTGWISSGLNIALDHSKGDIVALYIGHAIPDPDYLEKIADSFNRNDIDMVGGKVIPTAINNTKSARAIALVFSERLLVGNNSYTRTKSGPVRSTHWMAVKRELVEKVDAFNETFKRGEDCDWYERLIEAGAKSWFEVEVISKYYSRSTLPKLLKTSIQNAFYRIRTFSCAGHCMSTRHLLPGAGVLGIIIFSLLKRSTKYLKIASSFYLFSACCLGYKCTKGKKDLWPYTSAAIISLHGGHVAGLFLGTIIHFPKLLTRLTKKAK